MDTRPIIELTIRYGRWREKTKTICLPLDEGLASDLMEGQELSDEPFSLAVAGGFGRQDAVQIRQRTFKMRRQTARLIADAMVPALLQAFGVNDKLDGYKLDELSPEELAHHRAKGRL